MSACNLFCCKEDCQILPEKNEEPEETLSVDQSGTMPDPALLGDNRSSVALSVGTRGSVGSRGSVGTRGSVGSRGSRVSVCSLFCRKEDCQILPEKAEETLLVAQSATMPDYALLSDNRSWSIGSRGSRGSKGSVCNLFCHNEDCETLPENPVEAQSGTVCDHSLLGGNQSGSITRSLASRESKCLLRKEDCETLPAITINAGETSFTAKKLV